jgi:L-gulonate 5-dehydrogenase
MKAAVTLGPERMEVRTLADPAPGPGQALLAVCAVGLCGSDVHLYRGTHPYSRFPTVQGHEFSAVVKGLADDYDGPLRLGDLVAVEPFIPCRQCIACRRGHPNCCVNLAVLGAHVDGALVEEIVMDAGSCYAVGALDVETAALVEPVSIGLQAVTRSGAGSGDTVVVFGAGPIGEAAVLAAHDRGASVMAVDLLDNRLVVAAKMGADRTVNAAATDLGEAVEEWTAGDGPTVIIEATGVGHLLRSAVDLVAPSGTVVVVGISNDEVPLSVATFTRKEVNVLGSRNNAGLFGQAVDLVKRNQERAAQLITHRFKFAEVPDALEFVMTHADEAEKVLVMVQDGT